MAHSGFVRGASASLACTLASLASYSTLTEGRASAAFDATANVGALGVPPEDVQLSVRVTTGSSPTANNRIEAWVVPAVDDAPTYPDGVSGSDAAKIFTNRNILMQTARLAACLVVTSTSNVAYSASASVRELFGFLPLKFVIFVVHNTGVALNATAGNHAISVTPIVRKVA